MYVSIQNTCILDLVKPEREFALLLPVTPICLDYFVCNNIPDIMKIFNAGWYLIYTKPRHEKKIHAYLTEQRIDSFLPTRKILRNWHDRRKYVDEPLFPSYVFVYLNDIQNYYAVSDADGALHYVRSGKEIARVSDAVISNIRLVAWEGERLEISDLRFSPGKKLVIAQGPLTGLSCEVIEAADKKKKLLVRIDMLQRNLLLTLPAEHLAIEYSSEKSIYE
jgi:transcriptional antiterminator RfaH